MRSTPEPAQRGPALRWVRGRERGISWALAIIDPRRADVEVLTFGRRGADWTSAYAAVSDLPRDCVAAVNGTFFSLRYCEPVGILVHDRGRATWNPRVKRVYGAQERLVVTLRRRYLALLEDGAVCIGNSEGRSAEAVRAAIERRTGARVRGLVGGGGLLVSQGRVAVGPRSLAGEGFDARSGLREEASCRRTGVGITADGNLLMLTCGLEGGGLSLASFARLFVRLGAREAIFLDCGSSTAMRLGDGWQSGGRPVPVWLAVRRSLGAERRTSRGGRTRTSSHAGSRAGSIQTSAVGASRLTLEPEKAAHPCPPRPTFTQPHPLRGLGPSPWPISRSRTRR